MPVTKPINSDLYPWKGLVVNWKKDRVLINLIKNDLTKTSLSLIVVAFM